MAILSYGYNHLPTTDTRLNDLHIFGSSSKGNSIYFKDGRFLIDLGFPYKKYIEYDRNFFLKVDFIFLTHEHSDHLNPSTLFRIIDNYPAVRIIVSTNMWEDLLSDQFEHRIDQQRLISDKNHFYIAQPMRLINHVGTPIVYLPHITAHGPIKNCAIELVYNNKHVLYASDLDEYQPDPQRGTEGLPMDQNNPFDIVCLEANYDPKILYEYIKQHPYDFRAKQNLRHTSEKDAWTYVQKYMKFDGIFVPLHASSTFGTLLQKDNSDEQA